MRLFGLISLMFAVAVSALASKISVSTSSYGVGETMSVINPDVTIDGVDFRESVIPTTSIPGADIYVYYVLTDANNEALTGFDVTLPVTDLDTIFSATPYGVLGCDSTNDPLVTDCVNNPESNTAVEAMETLSNNPQLVNGNTGVEFRLPDSVSPGTAEGLALFVTEDVVPEPRLLPILGLAVIGVLLLLRRRSGKLA